MVNLVCYLANFSFFGIPLLYYYINPRSSIILCLFSEYINLSLGISLSVTIFSVSLSTPNPQTILLWTFGDFLKLISYFINNQFTSYFLCFLNCSFWSSFMSICNGLFNMINKFLAVYTAYIFDQSFCSHF